MVNPLLKRLKWRGFCFFYAVLPPSLNSSFYGNRQSLEWMGKISYIIVYVIICPSCCCCVGKQYISMDIFWEADDSFFMQSLWNFPSAHFPDLGDSGLTFFLLLINFSSLSTCTNFNLLNFDPLTWGVNGT